jgi:hypothetical protein
MQISQTNSTENWDRKTYLSILREDRLKALKLFKTYEDYQQLADYLGITKNSAYHFVSREKRNGEWDEVTPYGDWNEETLTVLQESEEIIKYPKKHSGDDLEELKKLIS